MNGAKSSRVPRLQMMFRMMFPAVSNKELTLVKMLSELKSLIQISISFSFSIFEIEMVNCRKKKKVGDK